MAMGSELTAVSVAAAVASAPVKPPSGLLDVFSSLIVDVIGTGPSSVHVTFAITSYIMAAIAVLPIRNSIENKWTTAVSWHDRIVAFFVATASSSTNTLEYIEYGATKVFKGRVELKDSIFYDVAEINKRMIAVARRGIFIMHLSRTLYSKVGFATLALCQTIALGIIIFIDLPHFVTPGYVPQKIQLWLCWIFLWPMLLAGIQLQLVPDWEKDFAEAEQLARAISQKYVFKTAEIT